LITDALGLGGQVGKQRPRVEEARLVGVVLYPYEVQPQPVGQARHLDNRLGLPRVRHRKEPEPQLMPKIAHDILILSCICVESVLHEQVMYPNFSAEHRPQL
jgi:hypothetical protein